MDEGERVKGVLEDLESKMKGWRYLGGWESVRR